jgi:LPS-assembly protein
MFVAKPGGRFILRFSLAGLLVLAAQGALAQERVRTEIPYRDGTVVLVSDAQERLTKSRYRAAGRVEITFQDMVITADQVEYDEVTREGLAQGNVRFSQDRQWLACSRAEFDLSRQTAVFYDAKGFTDREFLVSGHKVLKTGPSRYIIEEGFITACQEERPKWSFQTSSASLQVDETARLRHMVFKVKGVPLFYAPYLVVPMQRKQRSSGLLPFHTGNSSSKGRVFSQGYYQTLGRSADATIHGEYFTRRGLAIGGIFRARPNPRTQLYLQAYGISDRLQQGGAQVIVDGESLLQHGFRAVARVNVTSNFRFRQAFSDSFRSATVPQETSLAFLSRSADGFSQNFSFKREEVLMPGRSVVIRKSPSLSLDSTGRPIGGLPLFFYLRSSIEGASRVDREIETPKIVQRVDIYPKAELRLPALAGFSLIPSVGLRATHYNAHLTETPEGERPVVSESLGRRYMEVEIDLRTPTLEREFRSRSLGNFRHAIEPVAMYRRIAGIERFDEIVRFDQEDVIANTDEIEYGIVNRVFRERSSNGGPNARYEVLSFALKQKYFFDPSFGGALRAGESNIFYPLNTVTGFAATSFQRRFAPTSMILRVSPQPAISYDVRADYDTKLSRLRDVSVSTAWQQEKLTVAGTYFQTKALEPGTFESNHIQGQFGYGSTARGLSGSLTLSYNIRTSQLLNSHTRLNYLWDCCGVSLEFQQFDLGLRTESRFTFSFSLKGIGSFGNVRRPEALF